MAHTLRTPLIAHCFNVQVVPVDGRHPGDFNAAEMQRAARERTDMWNLRETRKPLLPVKCLEMQKNQCPLANAATDWKR